MEFLTSLILSIYVVLQGAFGSVGHFVGIQPEPLPVVEEQEMSVPSEVPAATTSDSARVALPAVASAVPQKQAPAGHSLFADGFNLIYEISSKEDAKPRGFIDASISGERFFVADGKLAFKVTYFESNKKNRDELRYDGAVVPAGTVVAPKDFKDTSAGIVIGGKTITLKGGLKLTETGEYLGTYSLLSNGTEIASGNGMITDIVDFKGEPAYVLMTGSLSDNSLNRKAVVMHKGAPISKEYPSIEKLRVNNGVISYLAQKNVSKDRESPLYVLIWNGQEYGENYDSVVGYIESKGVPFYMAANYTEYDGDRRIRNAQFLVSGTTLYFSAKPGQEMIWQEREIVDVNGKVAAIIRDLSTKSSYVYYDGKKLFEGYDILYVKNVSGKLAVLVGKDKTQYVLIEK